MQMPVYLEVRFSDNMVFRVSVSFIYSHYFKNPAIIQKISKEKFLLNKDFILNYATKNMTWGECSLSAVAIVNEIPFDYETEFKQIENKKIIFEEIIVKPELSATTEIPVETKILTEKNIPNTKPEKIKKKKKKKKKKKIVKL